MQNIASQITDWLNLKVNTKFMNSDNDTPFGKGPYLKALSFISSLPSYHKPNRS